MDEPVVCICQRVGCGKEFLNIRPTIQRRFCSHACRCADYQDRNFIKRRTPKKGKPVIPVKPWNGPACFCGAPGRYEGKCGNHNFHRRYETTKRNKLIKQFIGDADNETIKLALLNFGTLNELVG